MRAHFYTCRINKKRDYWRVVVRIFAIVPSRVREENVRVLKAVSRIEKPAKNSGKLRDRCLVFQLRSILVRFAAHTCRKRASNEDNRFLIEYNKAESHSYSQSAFPEKERPRAEKTESEKLSTLRTKKTHAAHLSRCKKTHSLGFKSVLNHTPDDRERENNLLLLCLLRAFACVSEDALFEAKFVAIFEGKFWTKVSEKTCTQTCATIRFSYER